MSTDQVDRAIAAIDAVLTLYFGTEIFSPAKCCNLPATVLWLPEGES